MRRGNDAGNLQMASKDQNRPSGATDPLSRYDICLIIAMIVYPVLFIWQGIDLTDQGYALTSYQRIFDVPPSVLDNLTLFYWLSVVIGGLWNQLLGEPGVLAFKWAYVFNLYLILIGVYYTLREDFDRTRLLLAMLLTLMFIIKAVVNWVQYNSLTALFFVVAGFFLLHGLKKKKDAYLFFAAMVLGLNIFIKIPNILGLSLFLVPVYYGYMNRYSAGRYLRLGLVFFSGAASGILVVLLAMYRQGHAELYLNAFMNIFSRLTDKSDGYSANSLGTMLIDDTTRMLVLSVFSITAVIGCAVLLSRLRNKPLQYIFIGALSIIAYFGLAHKEYWKFIYPGALCFVLLYLWLSDRPLHIRVLALMSFILLYASSLGSGNGIRNMLYGMWIGMPVALLFLMNAGTPGKFRHLITPASITFARKLGLSIIIVSTLLIAVQYTYRDSRDRRSMVHQVDHHLLKGLFTTKERAAALEEVLSALSKHAKEGDELFAYEGIQLIYFLTNTKPYLYHAWPMLYAAEEFEGKLKKAQQEKPGLPVVVRARANTKNPDWPSNIGEGLEGSDPNINRCRRIAQAFLADNNYSVVWENNAFQILLPTT